MDYNSPSIKARRNFLTSAAAVGLTALAPRVFAQEKDTFDSLKRTPLYVGTGPYYPAGVIPWASNLTRVPGEKGKAKGQVLYVVGNIGSSNGDLISGAKVELWQADIEGHYKHPVDQRLNQKPLDPNFRYFGHVITQLDGTYMFKTILPKWYTVFGVMRCPHIHFRIKHPEYGEVTTQLMFEGKEDDEIRKKDGIFLTTPDFIKPQIVVPKQKPTEVRELSEKLGMEPDALVCRFNQSFI